MFELIDSSLLSSAIRMVSPILLAGLGGAICSKVGLFNVALEGLVLVGAFAAILGNYLTGSLTLAILFAIVWVVLLSLVFAYFSIDLKANVIVVGIAINFLAAGLTTFALRTIFHVKGAYYNKDMVGLPHIDIPLIKDIPGLGPILSGHSLLVYLSIGIAFVLYFYFYKTVSGFRLLAVGENPIAAQSQGIKVRRIQYGAVVVSGVLCALAGAQLSLGQLTMFSEGMTSGRGFIALVATMLGQANPIGVLGASFLFGLMDAVSIRLQGMSVPTQFTLMLPYLITLITMFFFKDKSYLETKNTSSSR